MSDDGAAVVVARPLPEGPAAPDSIVTGRSPNRFGPGSMIVTVAVLALGFGVAATSGLWTDPAGRIIDANIPDALHYAWWLGHTQFALWNGQTPLQTSHQNWPVGVSAMNNTSLLLPAVLLAPLSWMATSLTSLNVLNLLAVPACAAGGYWALRQLPWGEGPDNERIGRPAALVGAVTFAISPAIVNSLVGHITMAFAPAMPVLIVLSVAAWSGTSPRRTGVLLGLTAAVQLFTGEEVLFLSVFAAVLILLISALSRPRAVPAATKRLVAALGVALAIFTPIAAYPLYLQFFGPLKEHGAPFSSFYIAADITAFTTPTKNTLLHTAGQAAASARFTAGIEEHLAYLGWPLLIACLLTTVLGWRRLPVRCAGIGMLVAMVLSLGSRVWVNGVQTSQRAPDAIIGRIPVINGSLAARFALVAAIFAGALLAFAVHGLCTAGFRRGRPLAGGLLATALSLVCLLPLLPRPLPVVEAPSVPPYFSTAARHLPEGSVALVLPYPSEYTPIAMRWQSAARYSFRMPGGYFLGPDENGQAAVSGQARSATGDLLSQVVSSGLPVTATPQRRAQVARDLSTWGADLVVLGPCPHQDAVEQSLTNLLGFAPQRTGGVEIWPLPTPE